MSGDVWDDDFGDGHHGDDGHHAGHGHHAHDRGDDVPYDGSDDYWRRRNASRGDAPYAPGGAHNPPEMDDFIDRTLRFAEENPVFGTDLLGPDTHNYIEGVEKGASNYNLKFSRTGGFDFEDNFTAQRIKLPDGYFITAKNGGLLGGSRMDRVKLERIMHSALSKLGVTEIEMCDTAQGLLWISNKTIQEAMAKDKTAKQCGLIIKKTDLGQLLNDEMKAARNR